jgi:hypothetical protein
MRFETKRYRKYKPQPRVRDYDRHTHESNGRLGEEGRETLSNSLVLQVEIDVLGQTPASIEMDGWHGRNAHQRDVGWQLYACRHDGAASVDTLFMQAHPVFSYVVHEPAAQFRLPDGHLRCAPIGQSPLGPIHRVPIVGVNGFRDKG